MTRQRAGHPLIRLTLAGIPAGKAAAGAAEPPARRLPWPCRPADRPALPPAGGVPPRPAAREARGRRRLRRQCARRYRLRATAVARPQAAGCGPAWPLEAARAAPPLRRAASAQAEPSGTACAVGGGRAGEAGRSAAARAGGADGPTAPTLWGPGRAGAPTPQPARGRSGARPRGARTEGAWPCGAEGYPRATAGGWLGLSRRRCCAAAAAAGG